MAICHIDAKYGNTATVSNSSILDLLTPLSEEAQASAKRRELPFEQKKRNTRRGTGKKRMTC
jgi:hypothetical protein